MNKLYRNVISFIRVKPTDRKIEIGTVVRLKSGGFDMTVQDISIGKNMWITNVYTEKVTFCADGPQRIVTMRKNDLQKILF